MYTYEKSGPSLDFRDDFIGELQQGDKDKWAGVEATGFRKKFLHEKVAKDIESLRMHLASITERVRSKTIGTTKEDKILLRKLSALLDVTEIELQAHQSEWRKAAKPKRKIRMISTSPLFKFLNQFQYNSIYFYFYFFKIFFILIFLLLFIFILFVFSQFFKNKLLLLTLIV